MTSGGVSAGETSPAEPPSSTMATRSRRAQKCLAHLRRHFKKVVSLSHGNNPTLGQVFLDLIDEAFAQHRYWREIQDANAYLTWASGFKVRITQTIEQWIGRAGYDAGKLLRSLRDKAEQWWYFQGPSRGATGL